MAIEVFFETADPLLFDVLNVVLVREADGSKELIERRRFRSVTGKPVEDPNISATPRLLKGKRPTFD